MNMYNRTQMSTAATTRTYTVTEALQELKLLSKKINNGISSSTFISLYRSDSNQDPALIGKDYTSKFQSVKDLINRRARIKAAIMQSNATTKVQIGDKEYTVAEAISTKEYLKDYDNLVEQLKMAKASVDTQLATYNVQRQNKIDDLINRSFGREGTNKQNADDIKNITEIYMKKNYATVVDPINLEKAIEELDEYIQTFKSQVDYKLSYINAITTIEVVN